MVDPSDAYLIYSLLLDARRDTMALALPSAMSVQRKTIRELLASNGPVFKTLQAVVRRIPMVAKWSAILLFLINVKSWPLMWHCEFRYHSCHVLEFINLIPS